VKNLLILLIFVATIAVAQFVSNWPITTEAHSPDYISASIVLLIVLALIILGYLHKNQEKKVNYRFRDEGKDDYTR